MVNRALHLVAVGTSQRMLASASGRVDEHPSSACPDLADLCSAARWRARRQARTNRQGDCL